jgi:hypothetical protein
VALTVVRPDTRTAPGTRLVTTRGGRGGGGGGDGATGQKVTYVVADPMPGVWEVRLTDIDDTRIFDAEQADKPQHAPPTAATLTVSGLAADLAVGADDGNGAVAGARSGIATQTLSITSRMAAFTGGATTLPVGSARRERPTIRDREQQAYEIDVPAGTAMLVARAGKPSDTGADLDVYVYDCSGKECRAAGVAGEPVGDASVTVQNPAAGKWKVVVDAASVPTGSTSYDYLDVVFNPTYGTVGVADTPQSRKMTPQWTTQAHVWVTSALPSGRTPFAALLVQGTAGADRFPIALLELTPAVRLAGAEK